MNSMMHWMMVGTLALCAWEVAAGSQPEQQQQTRRPAGYLCAQMQMTGHSGGSYPGQALCVAARNVLERDAKSDGVEQCRRFCDKLSCTHKTQPDPLTATSSCKKPDPVNRTWYGAAETVAFECKCSNP
jgi:hypothetical protein